MDFPFDSLSYVLSRCSPIHIHIYIYIYEAGTFTYNVTRPGVFDRIESMTISNQDDSCLCASECMKALGLFGWFGVCALRLLLVLILV